MYLLAALLASQASATATAGPAWPAHYQRAAEDWKAERRDDALKWFYVGQLRGRTQVNCVPQEPSGGPALIAALQEVLGTPINGWAGGDPDRWIAGIDAALAWDAATPDPDVASEACRTEKVKQRDGLRDLRRWIDTSRAEIAAERVKNGLPSRK